MASALSFCGLAGLVLVMGVHVMADNHYSDGDGGEVCGPDDRVCLQGHATCNDVTGNCDCDSPPYAYGDGYINCYRGNTFRTEIYNDPNVMTYNNISVGLPIPCRYLWTHTKTYLKNKKRKRVGFCEMKAYAFHHKLKGKFYVGGYDVAIKVTYDNGTVIMASIRKYGKADNGTYTHCINATDDAYLPQGPWGDDVVKYYDPVTNLLIKCQYDDENNLALLIMKKCGISIQFRPYDCTLKRDQPQVPYASYAVNCAFHPVFYNQDKVVAISPSIDHQGGPTIDGYRLPGLNRKETLIYRAINSGALQNSPFPNDQCETAKDVMATCNSTELDQAFENCMWILESPRFIRCYDNSTSGEYIMELFNKCFEVFCDFGDCSTFIGNVTTTGCHNLTPPYDAITTFVSGVMCP